MDGKEDGKSGGQKERKIERLERERMEEWKERRTIRLEYR